MKAEIAKLEFLRGLDAHTLDLSVLPAERRWVLATVGRRLTAQALQRREPERRYPILLTLAGEQGRAQDAGHPGRARQVLGKSAGAAGRDPGHRRRPGCAG
jgi:hypothetical protein